MGPGSTTAELDPPLDGLEAQAPPAQLPEGIGRLQRAAKLACSPLFRFCWRVEAEGLDRVPPTGPAVICPNHVSVIDSFILPWVLPRPITFVGKAEYLEDWKTRTLFPALGMIPIDRRGGDQAKAALAAARNVLERGELFGIYPEGTRSPDGRLYRGHTGAARLALETGAPIVPVGIVGTREIQPPGQAYPKPFRRALVRFGEPIDVAPYQQRRARDTVHRQLIDDVMFQIRELCGQEYVNTYARSRRRDATPAGAAQDTVAPRRSSAELLAPQPLPA
jgi:1-acyl-sn-glycerol-3-phosphate acyltransferase